MVDPALLPDLSAHLSKARLAPYVAARHGDDSEAIRLYTWNVQVSAAFWGPLHVLEIVLRNAEHDQLCQHFRRPDWWNHPKARFHHAMADQLAHAINDATKNAKRNRRPAVPDDVVASLGLGFWTGLIGSGGKLQYETRYWQPAISRAFPHYNGSRADLHRALESLRLFRNRIAHHEPIVGRHLAADHQTMLRLAEYIDPSVRLYIETHSRVPHVLASRSAAIAGATAHSF